MGIKDVIRLEADTVTEQPIRIPFEFKDLSSLPEGKKLGDSIVISPITVRTWFKLKPLLLQFDKTDIEKIMVREGQDVAPETPEIMSKYDVLVLDIICLGIHNKKSDPPAWFREVLKDNSTWQDIHVLLNAVLFRIGYNPFCKSIMTLKNMSPLDEREIIALSKNQESWTSQ